MPRTPLPEETKDLIERRYRAGDHQLHIARDLGIHTSVTRRVLVERSVPLRSAAEYTRSYRDNDRFFQVIDSHEKAHILGFLCADGYIGEDRGRIALKLAAKDLDYLQAIRDRLAPQRPLLRRWTDGAFGRHESVEVEINSRAMVADLVALGLRQRKSLTLQWPTGLPDEFLPSFLLGYFDGDGCLSQDARGCRIVTFLGTTAFLQRIADILNARFGTILHVASIRGNAIHKLQITGNWQIIAILDWLYSACGLYLQRKRERYDALKRDYEGRVYNRPKAAA